MGTHTYIMEFLARKKGEEVYPIKSCMDSLDEDSITNMNSFIAQPTKYRFIDSETCREFVVGGWGEYYKCAFLGKNLPYNHNNMQEHDFKFTYRCMGQMYTNTVQRIIDNPGVEKKLEKLFQDVYGITVHISPRTADIDQKILKRYINTPYILFDGTTQEIKGGIDIAIETVENKGTLFGYKLSTIFALLREPLILEGVIEETIVDKLSLVEALVNIAYERFLTNLAGYECWNLVGRWSNKDHETVLKSIIESLSSNYVNSDGSSYWGILYLAKYTALNDRYSEIFNTSGFTWNNGCHGPVQFLLSLSPKLMENNSLMKYFRENDRENLVKKVEPLIGEINL